MNIYSIECAILSSLLHHEEIPQEKPFTISEKYFRHPFNKRVAKQIKECEDSLYFLSFNIQEKVKDTSYEGNWLDILSQTPLPLDGAKKYYELLKQEHIRARHIKETR